MNLLRELQANQRLRIGLALIIAILWLNWLVDLKAGNDAAQDRYRQVASKLARFGAQQQGQWTVHAKEAGTALDIAESRVWRSATAGLAQAEFRDWLLKQVQQVNAVNPLVKVAESVEGDVVDPTNKEQGDSTKRAVANQLPVPIRAQVEFNNDGKALNGLLAAFAGGEHMVSVESLTVKQPRISMTVATWAEIEPPTADGPVRTNGPGTDAKAVRSQLNSD